MEISKLYYLYLEKESLLKNKKNFIIINIIMEDNFKLRMNNYANLHKLDNLKNIIYDFKIKSGNNMLNRGDIASYIHKNINKMDDIERKHLLLKLLDNERINSDLLKYELKYLNLGKKITSMNKFVKFVDKMLKRYHTAGGYHLEDTEWSVHHSTSTKYPLKINEVLFENSIKRVHKYDFHTRVFLNDLRHFFRIHMGKNLMISYKFINYTDEICWIIFKITKLIE